MLRKVSIGCAVVAFLVAAWAVTRPRPHHSAAGAAARAKPFVGSVKREIYHRPTCKWAAKIPDGNLLGWDSADGARADERRACRVCHPDGQDPRTATAPAPRPGPPAGGKD